MPHIEVTLLGSPRVVRDGEPVAFDTRKAMALLAHLALAERPRPREVVAELLWPGHDPDHARGALRRTLSTLRSAIGPEALAATRDRVALVRGPGMAIDVDRFRASAAAGDDRAAVEACGGELLEGFSVRDAPAFEDWQRGEADGVRRELAAVLARLVDATRDLALAQRWLALDPLHEPAHRALIRLYAEGGDRAAALAQYRECVRTLSRELGVPPLAATTRLYEAISEGTHEAAAEPPQRPASPPAAPLVGRADDRRSVLALLDDSREAAGVAVLEGEAGIGKTRLAEEIVAEARRRGAPVLAARAYEEESALAYGPLVTALRRRLDEDPAWVQALPAHALAEVSRLLPELGAAPPGPDGQLGQSRFLDALWTTLTTGAGSGVLALDDAQWADEATLGLIAYGLRRLTGRRLLVLLTWRTPPPILRRAVGEAAGSVVRRLGRLTEADVGELVAATRPGAGPDLVRRLHGETEGLPFLLVEYLSAPDVDAPWPLPAGARELLLARLDAVSETGRQVLSAASVIGRSFDVGTLRSVSGRGEEETAGALEELVHRGLVREGRFDYDFAHERLRTLVHDETGLARRRLLHGRAADAIGSPAAAVARHLRLAGREVEAATAYARAAQEAAAVFANVEALGHLRAALALGHRDAAALHADIGALHTLHGDYADALASYEMAAADGPPDRLAGLEHRIGQVHHRRGEWALAATHFEAALAASPDLGARARITADLSLSAHDGGEPRRAAELAEAARGLAEQAGDPRALGQAHNVLGSLATSGGDTDVAIGHLERSLGLAETADEPSVRAAALNNLALAYRARGELDRALELTRAALELCASQGDRHHEAALHNNLADLHHASGRPGEAMDELKRAVAIFAEVGGEGEPRPEVWKLARW